MYFCAAARYLAFAFCGSFEHAPSSSAGMIRTIAVLIHPFELNMLRTSTWGFRLSRNDSVQIGKQRLCKADQPRPRFCLTIVHGRDQANQSAIGAIARDGVGDCPEFACVFTGNYAAATLIPIQDHLFAEIRVAAA